MKEVKAGLDLICQFLGIIIFNTQRIAAVAAADAVADNAHCNGGSVPQQNTVSAFTILIRVTAICNAVHATHAKLIYYLISGFCQ